MKCLSAIFLTFFYLFSEAQLPEYYVDLIKGDITVKNSKGRSRPVPLKARSLVFKEDIITLKNDSAELTLVNKAALYIVLNKKGSYPVTDLINKPKQKSAGLTEKYFQLVWEQLENPSKTIKSGLEHMIGSWGGVNRGSCNMGMLPFDNWTAFADSVKFKWRHSAPDLDYTLTLMDENFNPVLECAVRDTQIVLKSTGLLTETRSVYYWKVQNTSKPCSEVSGNKLTWLSKDEYETQTRQLIGTVKNNGTKWYYFDLANLMFSNHFYELAAEYLVRASIDEQ